MIEALQALSLTDALIVAAIGGMLLTLAIIRVCTWFIDRDIARYEEAYDAEQDAKRVPHIVCDSLSTMRLGMAPVAMIDPRSL